MYHLFFGDVWSILSTVSLLFTVGYIIITAIRHRETTYWGRKTLTLFILALLLCMFAVMRDDYVAAMQGGTGVFLPDALQIRLAYLGAAISGFCLLASAVLRRQPQRKLLFFILAVTVLLKASLIEISRIIL